MATGTSISKHNWEQDRLDKISKEKNLKDIQDELKRQENSAYLREQEEKRRKKK